MEGCSEVMVKRKVHPSLLLELGVRKVSVKLSVGSKHLVVEGINRVVEGVSICDCDCSA